MRRLDSWQEIAEYLGREVRTVQILAEERESPNPSRVGRRSMGLCRCSRVGLLAATTPQAACSINFLERDRRLPRGVNSTIRCELSRAIGQPVVAAMAQGS